MVTNKKETLLLSEKYSVSAHSLVVLGPEGLVGRSSPRRVRADTRQSSDLNR